MSCIIHESCDGGNIDVTVTVFRGCDGRNAFHGAVRNVQGVLNNQLAGCTSHLMLMTLDFVDFML